MARKLLRTGALCGMLAVLQAPVGGAEGIGESLAQLPGKLSLESRIRYEVFDLAGGPDVDGLSHRIRYGYTTEELNGFRAMVEGETLYAWGHGRDLHPADNAGDGTELNQAWLSWKKDTGNLRLGRQIYTLDDHRFIGHVGWRQNIQTFDAVTGSLSLAEGVLLRGFYIDQVNTVTAANDDVSAYGLNASYQLTGDHALSLFYYAFGGAPDRISASNDTLGLRFTGKAQQGDLLWQYAFSYARQWENSDFNGRDFGHNYWAGSLSASFGSLELGAGMEILDGNGIHGFTTPLATLHKFNGFADVFLGASASGGLVNGLEDYYLKAAWTAPVGKGLTLQAIHHWFRPATGTGDYGTEMDLVAGYAFNKALSAIAKAGDYRSDGGSGGIGAADKLMFTVELNYSY